MNESVTILESVAKTLVINEKNEALVLIVGAYEAHPEKSHTPDLPGGMIEVGDGESERDGAVRETEEEAGIVIDPKDLTLGYAKTYLYPKESKSVTRFLYIAHLKTTPDVVISWEHENYEWVPLSELLATRTFRPFYAEAIQYVTEHGIA